MDKPGPACGRAKRLSDGEENDFLWQSWEFVFPHNFYKVAREHGVYGCLTDWEAELYGGWKIDYVVDFCGRRYLIEAKLGKTDSLHSGFKIIAYRAAYCIDRVKSAKKIGAMIFFNSSNFESRMRGICAVSGIDYAVFGVKEFGDKKVYDLKECSLW